jgi:hypothetical protein
MNKFFSMRIKISFLSVFFTLMTFIACKKEGDLPVLSAGTFDSSALTTSATTLVLNESMNNDTVLTYSWKAASFGANVVVSYTLQFSAVNDTSNNWATATRINIENRVLTHGFTALELNNLLTQLNLTPGVAAEIAVRIIANVNQFDGKTSVIPPVYSNTLIQTITPYGINLFVPGEYQGWDPSTAPRLAPVTALTGLYDGFVYMPGQGPLYFKYTSAPDWNHTNYGDGGNGTLDTDGLAAGLSVPVGGYYYLTANLQQNTWTATKTTWGIIGAATPGGWDADTELNYDESQQVWTVTTHLIANGSFKFRANKAWSMDLALDNEGKLQYANHPLLPYNENLQEFSVAEDGVYKITLDLHNAGNYSYSIVKQ